MGFHVSQEDVDRAHDELWQISAALLAIPKSEQDDYDRGRFAGLGRGECAFWGIYRRARARSQGGMWVRFAKEDIEMAIQEVAPSPVALPECGRTHERGVKDGRTQATIVLQRIL